MAKKKETAAEEQNPVQESPVDPEEESFPGGEEEGVPEISTDFNVEDEFKPEPLIPTGSYRAKATKIIFDGEQQAIVWTFCLNDNGGFMSDGETPIDGATIQYRNWLPRAGDENTLTSNGRSTKRQSKINMLKRFADEVGIDMTTPTAIINALSNQEWIGIEVELEINSREYEGKIFNDCKRVKSPRS